MFQLVVTEECLEFMSLCLRDWPSIVEFAFVRWTSLLEPNLRYSSQTTFFFHLVCLLLMGICFPGLACFGAGVVCIRSFLAYLFASLPVSATLRIIPSYAARLPLRPRRGVVQSHGARHRTYRQLLPGWVLERI